MKKIRKYFAIILMIICVSSLNLSVFASKTNVKVSLKYSYAEDFKVEFDDGFRENIHQTIVIGGNNSTRTAYCIERGTILTNSLDFTEVIPNDRLLIDKLTLVDYYGHYKNIGGLTKWEHVQHHTFDDAQLVMCQVLIWELLGTSKCTNLTFVDKNVFTDGVNKTETRTYTFEDYLYFKNAVLTEIEKFENKPSFNGEIITLKKGESITLTDTNGSFSNYRDECEYNTTGATLVKNGNTLTITADSDTVQTGTIKFDYYVDTNYDKYYLPAFNYTHSSKQSVMTGGFDGNDPADITINLEIAEEIKTGNLKLIKTSEDNIVEGLQFRVTGNGVDETVTTGANGEITVDDLLPATYTITEVNTPNKYEQPQSQEITVVADTTTEVNFNNVLKRGDLKIVKTSEDNIVEGLQFRVTGNGVDETVTTGANGEITVDDLLPATYTITEVNTPNKYEQPQSQEITVVADETTTVSFNNVLKRGSVVVNKTSTDGTLLSGMTASIYKDVNENKVFDDGIDTLQGELVEGKTGVYTLDELLIGSYIFIENSSPAGHIKDDNVYPFTIVNSGETVIISNNGTDKFVNDTTKVEISKKDIATDEELAGAELHIEDKDGNVIHKWTSTDKPHYIERMPVGKYTLVEDLAPLGYLIANSVEFEVTPTGDVQSVEMFDDYITNIIRLSKSCSISGDLLEGATYGLYDMQDNLLQELTTDATGWATSKPVRYGKYYIQEITPPIRYLLDKTKYQIEIIEIGVIGEIELNVSNEPQPDCPQTGDMPFFYLLFLVLIIISIIGAFLIIMYKMQKK